MNTPSFSFKETIAFGYRSFKHHVTFFILAGLVTALVQLALQVVQNATPAVRVGFFTSSIIMLIAVFIGILITLGWTQIFLKVLAGATPHWNDFKSESPVWVRFIKTYLWYIGYSIMYALLTSILFIIVTIIGFFTGISWLMITGMILTGIALIATAVYMTVRYRFLKFMVIETTDLSSRALFTKTGSLTQGNFFKILGFIIVLGLINLLGLICLGVGLLVTLPTTKLAEASLYKRLTGHHTV